MFDKYLKKIDPRLLDFDIKIKYFEKDFYCCAYDPYENIIYVKQDSLDLKALKHELSHYLLFNYPDSVLIFKDTIIKFYSTLLDSVVKHNKLNHMVNDLYHVNCKILKGEDDRFGVKTEFSQLDDSYFKEERFIILKYAALLNSIMMDDNLIDQFLNLKDIFEKAYSSISVTPSLDLVYGQELFDLSEIVARISESKSETIGNILNAIKPSKDVLDEKFK